MRPSLSAMKKSSSACAAVCGALLLASGCGSGSPVAAVKKGIESDEALSRALSERSLKLSGVSVEWSAMSEDSLWDALNKVFQRRTDAPSGRASGTFTATAKATERLYGQPVRPAEALQKLGVGDSLERELNEAQRLASSMFPDRYRDEIRELFPNGQLEFPQFVEVSVPKGETVTFSGTVELTKYRKNWQVLRMSFGGWSVAQSVATPESKLPAGVCRLDDSGTKKTVDGIIQKRRAAIDKVNEIRPKVEAEVAQSAADKATESAEAIAREARSTADRYPLARTAITTIERAAKEIANAAEEAKRAAAIPDAAKAVAEASRAAEAAAEAEKAIREAGEEQLREVAAIEKAKAEAAKAAAIAAKAAASAEEAAAIARDVAAKFPSARKAIDKADAAVADAKNTAAIPDAEKAAQAVETAKAALREAEKEAQLAGQKTDFQNFCGPGKKYEGYYAYSYQSWREPIRNMADVVFKNYKGNDEAEVEGTITFRYSNVKIERPFTARVSTTEIYPIIGTIDNNDVPAGDRFFIRYGLRNDNDNGHFRNLIQDYRHITIRLTDGKINFSIGGAPGKETVPLQMLRPVEPQPPGLAGTWTRWVNSNYSGDFRISLNQGTGFYEIGQVGGGQLKFYNIRYDGKWLSFHWTSSPTLFVLTKVNDNLFIGNNKDDRWERTEGGTGGDGGGGIRGGAGAKQDKGERGQNDDTPKGSTCPKCEGNGKFVCEQCKGIGRPDCTLCNGIGRPICKVCDGKGYNERTREERCVACGGMGKLARIRGIPIPCVACGGIGRKTVIDKVPCTNCNGAGKKTCPRCNGDGYIICATCNGKGHQTCARCKGEGKIP